METKAIVLSQLEYQLSVLNEDKRKTNEKMFQILGGIKVIGYLIEEYKRTEDVPASSEGVTKNG